jgi:predicted DNA-binding transcriptional regulator AlpA
MNTKHIAQNITDELAPVIARALELVRPAYLSREQLESELGITRPTLRDYESRGLPVHQLGPRTFRFIRSEVEVWIKSHGRDGHGSSHEKTEER